MISRNQSYTDIYGSRSKKNAIQLHSYKAIRKDNGVVIQSNLRGKLNSKYLIKKTQKPQQYTSNGQGAKPIYYATPAPEPLSQKIDYFDGHGLFIKRASIERKSDLIHVKKSPRPDYGSNKALDTIVSEYNCTQNTIVMTPKVAEEKKEEENETLTVNANKSQKEFNKSSAKNEIQ